MVVLETVVLVSLTVVLDTVVEVSVAVVDVSVPVVDEIVVDETEVVVMVELMVVLETVVLVSLTVLLDTILVVQWDGSGVPNSRPSLGGHQQPHELSASLVSTPEQNGGEKARSFALLLRHGWKGEILNIYIFGGWVAVVQSLHVRVGTRPASRHAADTLPVRRAIVCDGAWENKKVYIYHGASFGLISIPAVPMCMIILLVILIPVAAWPVETPLIVMVP